MALLQTYSRKFQIPHILRPPIPEKVSLVLCVANSYQFTAKFVVGLRFKGRKIMTRMVYGTKARERQENVFDEKYTLHAGNVCSTFGIREYIGILISRVMIIHFCRFWVEEQAVHYTPEIEKYLSFNAYFFSQSCVSLKLIRKSTNWNSTERFAPGTYTIQKEEFSTVRNLASWACFCSIGTTSTQQHSFFQKCQLEMLCS